MCRLATYGKTKKITDFKDSFLKDVKDAGGDWSHTKNQQYTVTIGVEVSGIGGAVRNAIAADADLTTYPSVCGVGLSCEQHDLPHITHGG